MCALFTTLWLSSSTGIFHPNTIGASSYFTEGDFQKTTETLKTTTILGCAMFIANFGSGVVSRTSQSHNGEWGTRQRPLLLLATLSQTVDP